MSSIRSIVVPVDFSKPSRAASARAGQLALQTGAALHVVHSARLPAPAFSHEFAIPGPEWEPIRKAAQKEIEDLAAELREQGIAVTTEVSDRETVATIENAVAERDADLIVMGTHGHSGMTHLFLGSVAERVARTAKVPVMAVKTIEDGAQPIRTLLLASDFSAPARFARDFAVALAKETGAQIHLLHAVATPSGLFASYDTPAPADYAAQIREFTEAKLREEEREIAASGVRVEAHLVEGVASQAIAEAVPKLDVDLVVMATRGNTGLRHVLLGSVAERTLRQAPCAVLVVRPKQGAAQ